MVAVRLQGGLRTKLASPGLHYRQNRNAQMTEQLNPLCEAGICFNSRIDPMLRDEHEAVDTQSAEGFSHSRNLSRAAIYQATSYLSKMLLIRGLFVTVRVQFDVGGPGGR